MAEGTAKEETVLSLTTDTNKLLAELESVLVSHFGGLPEPGRDSAVRPEEPNILDTILDSQKLSIYIVKKIFDLLNTNVVRKVH